MPSAPGHVDALSAGVVEAGDTFSFAFTLAAPIPTDFELPGEWDALLWSFCLDTDGSSAPSGYPFAASTEVRSPTLHSITGPGIVPIVPLSVGSSSFRSHGFTLRSSGAAQLSV